MIQLDANEPVDLLLKAGDVAIILQGLGELKLKLAKGVDAEINRQLEEQFGKRNASHDNL